jgi:hypothetical protein
MEKTEDVSVLRVLEGDMEVDPGVRGYSGGGV